MRSLRLAACLVPALWVVPAVAQNLTVENTVSTIRVGASPESAAISRDGRHLYVANHGGQDISVIDTATEKVSSVVVGNMPHALVLSHDGRRLYALAGGDGRDAALIVIDTADVSSIQRISLPGRTDALALTPDDKRLYLARVNLGVFYFDVDSPRRGPVMAVPDICPIGIAISPDGSRLFVNYQCYGPGGSSDHPAHDAIVEYELPSFQLHNRRNDLANVGDQIRISPDGKQLWAKGADACSRPDYPHDGCPSVPSRIVNVLRVSEDPRQDLQLLKSYDFSLADSNGRISFSPDGIAFVGGGIDLKTIDIRNLESIHRISIANAGDVVFSQDGNTAYLTVSDKNEVHVLVRGQRGTEKLRDAASALSPRVVTDILLEVSCPDGQGLTHAVGCSTQKGAYAVPSQVANSVVAARGVELEPGQPVKKPVSGEDAGCFIAQHLMTAGPDIEQLIKWTSMKKDDEFLAYTNQTDASSPGGKTLLDVTGHLAKPFNTLAAELEWPAVYMGVVVCSQYVATVLLRQDANGPAIKVATAKDASGQTITRDALRQVISQFLADLKNPCSPHPEREAEILYHILIPKQIEAELRTAQNNFDATKAKKLTIVWELGDALRYVPMDALFDGMNYLVKSYSSAILTATSFSTDSHIGPFMGVAAGDSLGDDQLPDDWVAAPLPNVVSEVRSLFYSKNTSPAHPNKMQATILLDDAAPPDRKFTTDNFQKALEELGEDPKTRQLAQRPIIHIASHFLLGDTAASSFLLTRSGLLSLSTLADRRRFPFTSTWLVTLSACETAAIRSTTNPGGQGEQPPDGHEVEGLGYVANEHGAHAVLASLWEVDDASTSILMGYFYNGVRHADSKAESLRKAEERILDGKVPRELNYPASRACNANHNPPNMYSHPHYWAPFILFGNWH